MRHTRIIQYPAILLLFVFAATPLSAFETLQLFGNIDQAHITAEMTILAQNSRQSRTIEVLYDRRNADDYRLLSRITAPPFLRNMKFLVVRESGHPNTWIKTSRGVRRIAEQGTSEPVFQSDFLIQDFYGWGIDAEAVELGSAHDPGRTRYQAQAGDTVLRFTMDSEYGLISEIEFLSSGGDLLRHYTVNSFQWIDGQPYPHTARMETPPDDTSTELRIESVNGNPSFTSRTFNPAGL
ncbi:MAG: outer membrane lipoprotein-sorting protein [Spirochaeta sp.]